MSYGGVEQGYLDELRADALSTLTDTAVRFTQLSSSGAGNSRGGLSESAGGRDSGYVQAEADIPCRLQHPKNTLGGGELEKGERITSADAGLMVLPYDQTASHGDKFVVTTRDGFVSEWQIRQSYEQTDQFTKVYVVRRIK